MNISKLRLLTVCVKRANPEFAKKLSKMHNTALEKSKLDVEQGGIGDFVYEASIVEQAIALGPDACNWFLEHKIFE